MIGVFGGTFDPPHFAHAVLADLACSQLNLEKVLWVVVGEPPHKPGREISPPELRADMVRKIAEMDVRFELSRVDLDRAGPHYTADTMEHLREQHPAEELAYIMGSDSLRDLPSWHEPRRIVMACDKIGVLLRPGTDHDLAELEFVLPGLTARVEFIEAPLIQISGSDIRRRVGAGEPFRYFVLPSTYKQIVERELYR